MLREFLLIIRESIVDLYRNPLLVVPSVILGVILYCFTIFAGKIIVNFQTTLQNVVWTIFSILFFLLVMSFFFSGLIGMSKYVSKRKVRWRDFTRNAKRFALKNFFIVLFILLISIAISRIAHYGTFYLGKTLDLEIHFATAIFFVIYLAGLLGILIFLTFSSFFLVVKDQTIKQSVNSSICFVRKNYPLTIVVTLLIFVVYSFLSFIPPLISEILEYLILIPLASLVLTKFVLRVK